MMNIHFIIACLKRIYNIILVKLKNLSLKKKILFGVLLLSLLIYIFCLPSKLFKDPYCTVVADRNNELLGARIASDGQWRFPVADTVPYKITQCLIQFEDRYFYYHWGVNPMAIGRAIVQNVKGKRIISGGSTLTMQTIRLSRKKGRTWFEKIKEMILATRLEFSYSKKEILALYASHAPFGGNVVGVEAAAWRYFGHGSDRLSWAEAATLAVLPNSPSVIHLAKNRKTLEAKRNRLLKRLYDGKVIDVSSYELAVSESLPLEPLPLPQIAPHWVTFFQKEHKGEYNISTLDKNLQLQVESIVERWYEEFNRSDIRNLAAIVIDVKNNQVLSYCGNVNFENNKSANQVDIIRAPRSTGSILKPFLYCAMLQEGELLPNTLLPDIPLNINGFKPQNFDMHFNGAVPASEAVARSLNIPLVFALQKYSVPKFYNFLKRAGFTTLNKPSSHYGLSLILGGAEATLWDVASAYAAMTKTLNYYVQNNEYDNGTNLIPPAILLHADKSEEKRDKVFQAAAVWQTFETLKNVHRPEEIDWKVIPSIQKIAWKTGTSYGFRDGWAVGVTTDYVVGVWVGNANGEGKVGLTGAGTAGRVMFDIFNVLPKSKKWFTPPYAELIEAEVCSASGHLKSRFCPSSTSSLIIPQGQKTTTCPYHTVQYVTNDGRFRVYESCANEGGIVQKSFFVLPPAWAWYYKQQHPFYTPLPPFKAGCGQDETEMPMQFVYPQANATISLPKQMDGSSGFVVFDLAHTRNNATVYWHLDETFVASTQSFHQLQLSPSVGKHVITVVDDSGNTLTIPFRVK